MTRDELRRWLLDNAFTKDGSYIVTQTIQKSTEHLDSLLRFTSFFDKPVTVADRAYALLNGQTELNKCVVCGKGLYPGTRSSQVYCGSKCLRSDPKTQAKIRGTCMERYGVPSVMQSDLVKAKKKKAYRTKYGVDNPMKAQSVRAKAEQTNLARYGERHASMTDEVKEKAKQTCLERYGVESTILLPEIAQKRSANNRKKYGVDHTLQIPEVRKKAEQTMIDRYGVCHACESPEILSARQANNRKKYGVDHTLQIPEVRKKAEQTMIDRYGVPNIIQSHISPDCLDKLTDDEWLRNRYEVDLLSVSEIADELGVEISCVNRRLRSAGAPVRPEVSSTAEKLIHNWLTRLIWHDQVILRDRSLIAPKEVDIYIPGRSLALEYSGVYWHTEQAGRNKTYHVDKTDLCESKGVQLLHIFDTDDLDIWKSVILSKLGLASRLYARETVVSEVTPAGAREFLRENHLQGSVNSSLRLGLYFEGVLMCLMTFGKSRFNKNYEWELLRFCTRKGYQVVGGASKLLKHSGIRNCLSYANRRWSNGKLYEALGFRKIGVSPPNYFYTKDHKVLLSRNQFQKHLLADKLDRFDPELTESENMKMNGYNRIWDCGNLVYVLQ